MLSFGSRWYHISPQCLHLLMPAFLASPGLWFQRRCKRSTCFKGKIARWNIGAQTCFLTNNISSLFSVLIYLLFHKLRLRSSFKDYMAAGLFGCCVLNLCQGHSITHIDLFVVLTFGKESHRCKSVECLSESWGWFYSVVSAPPSVYCWPCAGIL